MLTRIAELICRSRSSRRGKPAHSFSKPAALRVEVLESRIAPALLVTLSGGNVSVDDVVSADDALTVSVVSGNFRFHDLGGVTAADEAYQVDDYTVEIPVGLVTGSLSIDTALGADTVSFGSSLTVPGALSVATNTLGALPSVTAAALVLDVDSNITQSGALVISGTSSISAGEHAITLTHASNQFGGAFALSNSGAHNIAVTSLGALSLGASNVGSGTLGLSAGSISQSGVLTQESGAGAVSLSASSGAISLALSNGFTGVVSATASALNAAVSLKDGSGGFQVGGVSTNNGAITLTTTAGDLTLSGAVSSGGTLGGAISVTAGGRVVVGSGATLSSAGGSGGTLSLSESVTFGGSLTLGKGNITLQGEAGSMTISAPISVAHSLSLLASDDINILAKVETTLATANLTVTADSDLDGAGGLYVGGDSAEGWLKAGKNLEVSGSEYSGSFVPGYAASLASVIVSANGTSARLEAAGTVTISNSSAAPSGADVWLGGLVRSSGSGSLFIQNDVVLLSNSAWLETHGGGSVTFMGTVNGAYDLRVTSGTGVVSFEGSVGLATGLGSVLVDSAYQFSALATFKASGLTLSSVTGSASFADAVELGSGGLSICSSSLDIGSTASVSGGGAIFLQADSISLGGAISGTGALTLQPKTATRSIGLNGAGDFNLSAGELALLSNGFSSIQIGLTNGSGAVTIGGADFFDPVKILSPASGGSITLNGALAGIGNASVELEARSLYFNVEGPTAAISSGSSNVVFTGNVTLQQDTVLSAGGAITQTGFINSPVSIEENPDRFSLTATAGGAITINGGTTAAPGGASIGGAAPLSSLTLSGSSLSLQPQTITTGSQTYTAGGVILLRGGGYYSTVDGSITFDGPVETRAEVGVSTAGHTGDNITFTSSVDSESGKVGGLRLSAGLGEVAIDGATGGSRALGTLKVLGASNVSVGSAAVTTLLSITGTGAVTLGGTVALSAPAGSITITADSLAASGDLSADGPITLTANEIDFENGPGSVSGTGALTLRTLGLSVPMHLGSSGEDVDGQLDLSHADLLALADGFSSIYIGRTNALGSMTLDASGVQFNDPTTLALSTTKADITVLGALAGGGNASLTLNARFSHLYGAVSTSGQALVIRNAVLHGDVSANTAGGALTFSGKVASQGGAWDLVANAGSGALTFTSSLGTAAAPLGVFEAISSNLTSLTGSSWAQSATFSGGATLRLTGSVTVSNDFSAANAVTLTGNAVVKSTAGNIEFQSTVNGLPGKTPALSLSSLAGGVEVGGAIGGTNQPGAVSITAAGAVGIGAVTSASLVVKGVGISTGTVLTAGNQSYTGAITSLGGDLTGTNLTISASNSFANASSKVWTFTGMTTLKTISAGSISVTGAGHQLASLSLTGGSATIENSTATSLRTVSLAGSLDLDSGGSVSQTAKVLVHGLTIQSPGSINLGMATNRFWSLEGIQAEGEILLISGGHNLAINAAISTVAGNVIIAADAGTTRNQIINNFGANAITISAGSPYGYVLYSYDQSLTVLGGLAPSASILNTRYPAGLLGDVNSVYYVQA